LHGCFAGVHTTEHSSQAISIACATTCTALLLFCAMILQAYTKDYKDVYTVDEQAKLKTKDLRQICTWNSDVHLNRALYSTDIPVLECCKVLASFCS
jgi:hypothetical protein